MKQIRLPVLLLTGLIIIGAVGIVINNRTPQAAETSKIATSATIPTTSVAADNTKSAPKESPKGQYIAYSPNAIKDTPGTKLLFFHAPWCRQCQQIDASIKSQGVPSGVSIIKIDYDTSTQLRKQYDVTLQTTFVRVDDAGNTIEKFVAYREPTFDSVRRELL